MGGAPIIIPLVALMMPVVFVLGALVFDAAVVSWFVYRLWHDRRHGYWGRLLHRSS